MKKEQSKKQTTVQPQGNRANNWLNHLGLIAALFAFLLFINTTRNGYNFDDELVTKNHRLTSRGFSAIPDILSSHYYEDESGYAYDYRPIVLITFSVENGLFGDNVAISHLVNVLLYTLLCVLLYRCLRRFFSGYSYLLSFFITLLFAAYPPHTEVVASLKNRDEILAFIFSLLAFREALIYAARNNYLRLGLVAVYFTLAVFSKPSVVPFVFIIPVVMLTQFKPRQLLPVFAVLLITAVFTLPNSFDLGKLLPKAIAGIVIALLVLYRKSIPALVARLVAFSGAQPDTENNNAGAYSTPVQGRRYYLLMGLTMLNALVFAGLLYIKSSYMAWPIVIAIALFIFSKSGMLWQINLVVAVLALTADNFVFGRDKLNFIGLLIVALAYYNSEAKKYKWWMLLLAIPLLAPMVPDYKIMLSGVAMVALFALHKKYGARQLGGVLLGALAAFLIFKLVKGASFQLKATHLFIIAMGVFFLIPVQYKRALSLVMYAGLALLLVYKHPTINKQVSKPAISITDRVIKATYRPLEFMEAPVTARSPMPVRLGTALLIALKYLQKMLVPYPLSFYYGYSYITPVGILSALPLLSLAIHLALVIICGYFFNKNKAIFTGLAIYLIGIVAISNFFFPIPGMVADRFMLLPGLGFLIALAGVLGLLVKIPWAEPALQWRSMVLPFKILATVILVVYSALTFSRNLLWKDELTLMRNDMAHITNSAQGHNMLANNLAIYSMGLDSNVQQQTLVRQEALFHFKRAVEIYPSFFTASYYVGKVYALLNMPDSAIAAYKYAITLDTTDTYIYDNIGELYLKQGNATQAALYYSHRIVTNPAEYGGYSKLTYLYFLSKDYEKAVAVNRQAVERMPNLALPYINLGKSYQNLNQADSAFVYYNRALQVEPGNTEAVQLLNQFR